MADLLDAQGRRSLAFGVVVLSVTGLLLARGNPGSALLPPEPTRDTPAAFAEPPAEPPPATRATFARRGVAGHLALSHGRLLADGTRSMFVELRVRGEDTGERARAPLALVIVVDTSGSMAGKKIEDARKAARTALDEMDADDFVSIVRFSDDAEVLVPLARVSEIRGRAQTAIGGMMANGNTNIARAVQVASVELQKASQGRVTRVALVTDGRDTSGGPRGAAASIARRESGRGVTVSTLGIGLDYDDAYLADLASAGHGNYEFLRDASALSRFLSRELHETAKTSAQRVAFDLDLPPGARIREVTGATVDGHRITLGALFAGDERRVIVPIDLPMGESGSAARIGGTVSWLDTEGRATDVKVDPMMVVAASRQADVDESRDRSVHAAVTSVESSRRESEAAAAFARGDRATALSLNERNQADLARAAASAAPAEAKALTAQKRAYEADAQTYRSAPPSAAPARDIGAREHKNLARSAAF